MSIDQLTQLGIGGVAISAIVMIVKCFIGFITVQEKNFTKLLGNHINHNTKALQANQKTNDELVRLVREAIKYFKK